MRSIFAIAMSQVRKSRQPKKRTDTASDVPPLPPSLDLAGPHQLYTIVQAAKLLSISDWLLRKQIARGRLPVIVIDGTTRVAAADLLEFVKEHRHATSKRPTQLSA